LTILRIATHSLSAKNYIQDSLSSLSIVPEFVAVNNPSEALQLGEIDAFVSDLSDSKKQDSIVITALSAREDTSFALLISNTSKDKNQLFRLPENAQVLCVNTGEATQLLQYRSDVNIVIQDIENIIKSLTENNCTAALVSKNFINNSFSNHYEIIYFNIKEILPAAGAGVWAWHTLASDLPTRRALKPLHHSNVSECTNVERTAAALLVDKNGCEYAIFCDKNEHHYYTLSIAEISGNVVRTERLTSSTTFNLAADLVARFE
jgi:porphobilinogen deaminase